MNFDFTGVASNENGEFYIENGKVDFSKNGSYVYNGVRYNIINGWAYSCLLYTSPSPRDTR